MKDNNIMISKRQRRDLINIRRNRVMELLSQGQMNQTVVAQHLNISEATVSRDVFYIRRLAQNNLKTHIAETVPMEYSLAMSGLRRILVETNKIIDNEKLDSRTKLQALQLLASVHKDMMMLTSDGCIIEESIKKIKRLSEKVQQPQLQPTQSEQEDNSVYSNEETLTEEELKEEEETEEDAAGAEEE